MKIKSYFAPSVEAAVAQARIDFGPEALLMNSRKALAESRHLGEYEVVFACPNVTETKMDVSVADAAAPTPPSASDTLLKEIADLRRQMERMAAGVSRAASFTPANFFTEPEFAKLFSTLVASELDATLASSILSGVRSAGAIQSEEDIRRRVRQEVEKLCAADSTIGVSRSARIAAVIGPPGAGKTTCLAKLAIQFGLSARRPTQFLTLDTERIAAADQLHTFAEILGGGFCALESTHALSQAIEEHRNKQLVLIDTPGLGPRDTDIAENLAAFFSRREDIDIHLVLPCSMKPADISAAVDRFAEFRFNKLLFTRLDETSTFGVMLNESVRTGKPVSFLSTGQRIPEDFEAASTSRIAGLVLGDVTSKASVVAA